jgi:hypothetical protein
MPEPKTSPRSRLALREHPVFCLTRLPARSAKYLLKPSQLVPLLKPGTVLGLAHENEADRQDY